MKIMQVITRCELGGAQSVVVNLSNQLCLGHDVVVVSGEGDGNMWTMLDKRVKQEKINTLKRKLSPWDDGLTLLALRKLYSRYKPDIIHLHSSKIGILGRLVFPKSKIVYTVHGFDSIRTAYRKYLPIEKRLQKQCKAIIGVSQYDERNLLAEGITHHVSCIYNGICKPEGENTIDLSFMGNYKKKILCIARISKQKRFETFLEIALLLPDYAFVWIGNQEHISDLPSNVFCLGSLPNAGIYNTVTDLFILPTNYEGLPMVILEAMSWGRPVVASRVGGIREIVIDGENGFTVENQAKAFADKIDYILTNEDIYKRFSTNAKERFEKDLTVEKMVQEYLKIYKM